MTLIERYGGTHHGYFLPCEKSDNFPNTSFSFPNIGKNGPVNIAVALFSFPSIEKYEAYKREVSQDEQCKTITAHFEKTECFLRYERNFLRPIFPEENIQFQK